MICGNTGQASWFLSNLRNRGTAFILFGKPDDPADIWVARISNDDLGVVRIYSRDKTTSARLQ